MTSFRFNFCGSDDQIESNADKEEITWFESEEVVPDKQTQNNDELVTHAKMFVCGDIEIGHVAVSEVLTSIEDSGFKNAVEFAEQKHSDLVAGTYEGGLKIWECTHDLLQYLSENEVEIKLNDVKVLDLGCGAGILGIHAFLNGSIVTFQDYNKEVLQHVTIPNVLLNIEEKDENAANDIEKCKFYSGDWQSFNDKLPRTEAFDLILSSETIYNECNYEKLIRLLIDRLSKNGVAYIAAKTCYFGVGGGIRQFEERLKKNGFLQSEVCWKSIGGIQRELLKIIHKP